MDQSDSTPAQRAADSDREAAADALRAAGADGRLSFTELEERMTAVYAARTHPELDTLLADLRGRQELTQHAQPAGGAAASQTARSGGGPEIDRTRSIMGESVRRGFWRPAADGRVLTVMGETTIDLTEADLSRPVTHLRVVTIMGQTNIEVPDDVNLYVTKTTIMAQNDIDAPDEPLAGAPELHVKLVSIMGEARIRCRRRPRRSQL
jgi:hypothetical protein